MRTGPSAVPRAHDVPHCGPGGHVLRRQMKLRRGLARLYAPRAVPHNPGTVA
jgi:hypothetical protein